MSQDAAGANAGGGGAPERGPERGHIEVFANPRITVDVARERAAAVLNAEVPAEAVTLRTVAGPVLTDSADHLHVYAGSQAGVSDLIVLREFPILYNNPFTAAWLGRMLLDTQGGRLWIETLGTKKSDPQAALLTSGSLAGYWPSARFRTEGAWLCVEAGDGFEADVMALPSLYNSLHNGFEAFAQCFATAADPEGKNPNVRRAAEGTYKYSLFGANQKSFVTDRILRAHGVERPRRGLDVGGGYGFFAAEMAATGDRFVLHDRDAKKTEKIGPWLMQRAGVADRVECQTWEIEDLPRYTSDEPFDVVSFFGSLLYADRGPVPEVIQASMRLLRPGGLFVIHENVREGSKPGAMDYDKMFPEAELRALLRENAGEPTCYSMFTAAEIPWEQAGKALVMAAVQKT